jgi:hypothetical protein
MSGEIDPGWRRRGRVEATLRRDHEIAAASNSRAGQSAFMPVSAKPIANSTVGRTPVSHEARGLVRLLMERAEAESVRIERAVRSLPVTWMDGTRWRGTKGSKRVIERICAQMPCPPDLLVPRAVFWRYLSPLPRIPDAAHEPAQPCIAVKAVFARHKKPPRKPELLGLIVTAHALGRLFDRGGFDLDAAAAIFDAHNALLVLTPEEGAALWALGDSSIPLPAGPGFFVGESRVVGDIQPPVIICRTWLHDDQARARSAANAEAWRLLLAKSWDQS